MTTVRDLQLRLHADGRLYAIEVCAPGVNSQRVPTDAFDVRVIADVPANFADYDDDEPEDVVRYIVNFVKPLVPPSVSSQQWDAIATAVRPWVWAHRHVAACRDWELERHELAWKPWEVWRSKSACSVTTFASDNETARQQLETDAILLFTVYAESREQAMEISNELLGFETYKPMEDS